jgi:hypothetical protein
MRDLTEVYSNASYITQREVTGRCDLQPGNYVIIPSTFDKDIAMKFVLRVFIEGQAENSVNVDSYALVKQPEPQSKKEEEEQPSEKDHMTYEQEYYDNADEGYDNNNKQNFQIVYYVEDHEKEERGDQEDDHVFARRNYERPTNNVVMDPNGQVLSRACLIM